MTLEELIRPDNVLCNVSARSKKHCLEILSELLVNSNPDVASEDAFSRLVERERLGCTGLTEGVAFPHSRVEGIRSSTAALMKLAEPVDFDAADGEAVDIVFGMLLPENPDDHDRANIEKISALLREPALCARLRAASSTNELTEALLTGQLEPAGTSPDPAVS